MSCEQYEKWLFLHRPGELSQFDQAALESHLRDCPRCTALKEKLASDDRQIAHLRAMKPEAPDADAAVKRILLAVGRGKHPVSRTGIRGFLDVLALRVNQPRLRFAFALLVTAIVGTLLYQQYSLMSDVSNLEASMSLRRDRAGMIQAAFVLDAEALSRIPRSREILEALGGRVTVDSNNGILVTKEEARLLQETVAQTLHFAPRMAEGAALDAGTIEVISRAVQQRAIPVFHLSRKGGAG